MCGSFFTLLGIRKKKKTNNQQVTLREKQWRVGWIEDTVKHLNEQKLIPGPCVDTLIV